MQHLTNMLPSCLIARLAIRTRQIAGNIIPFRIRSHRSRAATKRCFNLDADFDLPKEKWKEFANCVEKIITSQTSLWNYPEEVIPT